MAAWELKVGSWIGCTLDGAVAHKAYITRVVSDTVVDAALIDDNGNIIQGAVELAKAEGLNHASPHLWWPA